MTQHRLKITVAIAAALMAGAANAAQTFGTNKADFLSAADALDFEGFETPIAQPATNATFDTVALSCSFSGCLYSDSDFHSDGNWSVGTDSLVSMTFTFDHAIHAFGINLIGAGTAGPTNLTFDNGNGAGAFVSGFESRSLVDVLFVGLVDSQGFTSVTLRGSAAGDSVFFDSLLFSDPANVTGGIPEPATWALMIAGFGGTGVKLRGRRRAAGRLA